MKPQLWRGAERLANPLAQSRCMYDDHVYMISHFDVPRLSIASFPLFRPIANMAVLGPKPLFRPWSSSATALRDRWITTLESTPTRSTAPISDIRVADAMTEF